MIYCDIGNTSVDVYREGKRTKWRVDDFDPASLEGSVHYVSVNGAFNERLQGYSNWHDMREYVRWENYYPTMGMDRIMACEAVDDGVIVDAGSAITVDVVKEGRYQGGFISLGLRAAQEAYARLSPALDVSFNFEVDLTIMAKNTPDALTVGFLAPLIHEIERLGKPIYVTGGDARRISLFLEGSVVDEALIFKGMKKLIEKG
ncbi:MAG: type III pantothenate kinase [Sulfuricurvum sp.]|jgi:type III pantothenate kinase|uniref:type III pantothenate kinase n=1 Tax=Sulfuricurvum sp. TaxID=2025608 RepID=UPI0025DBB907|nr:type III pantothenate kinase [Sulfuricurvum sp.]MCK9374348.1 type III pantothenate kinase [Sulfuricurvum sp.]